MFKKKNKEKKPKDAMTLEEFGEFVDEITSMAGCINCENCIPIGEGDHICTELDEPILVIEEYEPTDDYFACGGSCYDGGRI